MHINKERPTRALFFFCMQENLDDPGFREGFVCAVFRNRLDGLGRESEGDRFVYLGNKNALLLEIWLAPNLAGRVKFGSTNTVGVAATDLGGLFCYWTNLSHCSNMLSSF